MTMHDAVRALPIARERTCAQTERQRESARARALDVNDSLITPRPPPACFCLSVCARTILSLSGPSQHALGPSYLHHHHAQPPMPLAQGGYYYGPQHLHHHAMMMFDHRAYLYGAARPPEYALARGVGLQEAAGSAGSVAGAAIGVLMM